jgi:hypothetical protein
MPVTHYIKVPAHCYLLHYPPFHWSVTFFVAHLCIPQMPSESRAPFGLNDEVKSFIQKKSIVYFLSHIVMIFYLSVV